MSTLRDPVQIGHLPGGGVDHAVRKSSGASWCGRIGLFDITGETVETSHITCGSCLASIDKLPPDTGPTPVTVTGVYISDMRPHYDEWRVGVDPRQSDLNNLVARTILNGEGAESEAMAYAQELAKRYNVMVYPDSPGGSTGVAVALDGSLQRRRWRLEWKIPEYLTIAQVKSLVEEVRGFGSAVVRTQDEGIPVTVICEFQTTPEWTEFDLGEALREVRINLGDPYGMGDGFPTRPDQEVFPA